MTGTPLDLTPFGGVLAAIGWLYGLVALSVLAVAWWLPRLLWQKIAAVSIAVAAVYLVFVRPVQTRVHVQQHEQQTSNVKLDEAMALFKKRCETAGEKIIRTVDNVEGLVLAGVRPVAKSSDLSDPNWPDAAIPREEHGDAYIRTFLYWEHHEDLRMPRGYLNEQPSSLHGYRFVDVKDGDGSFYRYRLSKSGDSALSRDLVQGKPARYAIAFVNMNDPNDRAKWIAGTKVSITDTATGEVMAESTWYSIEPGQGNTAGFRSPWLFARSCPELAGWAERSPTRMFVDRILKPKRGE